MNLIRKIIILVCLVQCSIHTTFSQSIKKASIIPPSPSAASLGVFGEIPVDLYSGVPSIKIPIYNIKVRQLELPVELAYHASGIRVAQESGWVGLGWALKAGGIITRVVRGKDDLAPNGFYYNPNLPPADVLSNSSN